MALLTIVADPAILAERAAARVADAIGLAIRARGAAAVCLTGGQTPRQAYERLAGGTWRDRIAWEHVHVYWTDERHVPPDHPDSNYGLARDALVMHVPIPASHVHRIRGELAPDEAARLYERELAPRFDLMLLGVGDDTHVASLFPGSAVLGERRRRVAAVWAPHLRAYRITLTPRALLDADRWIVIVSGAAKAPAMAIALGAPTDIQRHPVHLLREGGDRVEWMLDRAAARDVSEPGA